MVDSKGGSKKAGRLRRVARWFVASRAKWALSAASGVLVFLSFPGWNFFPLAFVALVPVLAVAESRESPRHAMGWGWWMGLITNLGGFYWVAAMLKVYGFMPWSVALPLYLLLCVQQGLTWGLAFGFGRWMTLRGAPTWLAYPSAIALAESANPLIFPWYFGNSQFLNLPFIQGAELGGVTLLSGMLMLSNVAALALLRWKRDGGRVPVVAIAIGAAIGLQFAYGAVRLVQVQSQVDDALTVRVGAVQANVGIYEKNDPALLLSNLLLHQQLSAELERQGAELILWPETAYAPPEYYSASDGPPQLGWRLMKSATQLPPSRAPLPPAGEPDAEDLGYEDLVPPQRGFSTPLITGTLFWRFRTADEAEAAPTRRGRPYPVEIFNSAMLLDSEGRIVDVYDKTLRMIFSEYVPGGYAFYRLTGISLYDVIPGAGDFQRGAPSMGFDVPLESGTARVGVMICYEDIMGSFGRAIHSGGPEMIVNLTNDAWFLDTAEPELHLALSVFRSVEQRTSLIRATNTGISAVIDPTGRIVAQTASHKPAVLLYDVPRMRGAQTPFMVLGNWPSACALVVLVITGLVHRRRKRAGDESVSEA